MITKENSKDKKENNKCDFVKVKWKIIYRVIFEMYSEKGKLLGINLLTNERKTKVHKCLSQRIERKKSSKHNLNTGYFHKS